MCANSTAAFPDVTWLTVIPLPSFGEIERKLRDALAYEAQIDRGFARDFVAIVAQGHAKDVVLRVNARLPRIVVGKGGERESEEEREPLRGVHEFLQVTILHRRGGRP